MADTQSITRREFLAGSAAAGAVAGLCGFRGSHVDAAEPQNAENVPSCRPIVLHDDGRFEYGQLLAGRISGGKLHGVELTRGADGKPVTRAGCLNVEHYFSIQCNRRWGAHDFTLVGRDVKRGESVRCRAWMAYRKLDPKSLDDVLTWKGEAWKNEMGHD